MDINSVVITILSIAGGAFICYAGYRFFRLSLAIVGAFVGFIVGGYIYELAGSFFENFTYGKPVVLILFSAAFAILAFVLYMKAIILVSCIFFAWWIYTDWRDAFEYEFFSVILGLAIGVVVGYLVWHFRRGIIGFFTAVVGAKIISSILTPLLATAYVTDHVIPVASAVIFGGAVTDKTVILSSVITIALAATGFATQLNSPK